MTTKMCRLFHWCVFSCAALLAHGQRLQADEPPAAAAQTAQKATAPVEQATVPIAITGVVAEQVANLDGVLLQAAGQTDPLLEINVKPVDDVLRSHLGLAEGKGFIVTAVADESALAKAGVRPNDVLLTIAGENIASLEMLSKTLRGAPHESFTIGIVRAGKPETVEIKPGELEIAELNRIMVQQQNAPRFRLGVGLADADETLRLQLSLLGGEGLVVTSVQTDGPAAKAGVLVNDVLIRLDGKFLTSIDALSEQLQTIGDKSVSLEVLRRGKPATLTVTPEKKAPEQEFSVTLSQSNPNTPLYIYQSVPLQTYSANQLGFPVWNSSVYTVPDPNSLPGDPASRVANLLQQVKQLQASLEALEAALKAQPQPAEAGEKKSDP